MYSQRTKSGGLAEKPQAGSSYGLLAMNQKIATSERNSILRASVTSCESAHAGACLSHGLNEKWSYGLRNTDSTKTGRKMSRATTASATPAKRTGRARIARLIVATSPQMPRAMSFIGPPLPADRPHDGFVCEHVGRRALEDDLTTVDDVQAVG